MGCGKAGREEKAIAANDRTNGRRGPSRSGAAIRAAM